MLLSFKQFVAVLILASFLALALFSFATISHGGDMQGNCPFSAPGGLICPQNMLATAIHHILAFHTFLNVPVSISTAVLIIFLLLTSYVLGVLSTSPPIPIFLTLVENFYDSPPVTSHDRKIKRWLSLFENSPSRP